VHGLVAGVLAQPVGGILSRQLSSFSHKVFYLEVFIESCILYPLDVEHYGWM
jgi:hypothetical protein